MLVVNPIQRFAQWLDLARRTEPADPTAMALATADSSGQPSVRMVLLKHADTHGFVFYTNLDSPKSRALNRNPRAALCFHWARLERQVRVEGPVEPLRPSEADEYFATRPRLSQIGAWASPQSTVMLHPLALETAVASTTLRFGTGAVPRPPNWSGWRVVPNRIEFWQQRPFRRHEREVFVRTEIAWTAHRLFP